MRIDEFLLARIAEDEVRATMREWHADDCDHVPFPGSEYTYPCNCGVPERMKIECAVKRRIVEVLIPRVEKLESLADGEFGGGGADDYPADDILRALAQPHADHPDFDPVWRV